MVAPVVIVFAALIFYPLVRGIFISFTNLTEANQLSEICTKSITGTETCEPNPNGWSFVGLDNYANVLTGQVGEFWQWFTRHASSGPSAAWCSTTASGSAWPCC